MSKESFEKTAKKIIEYEESKFAEIRDFLKPYNEELSNQGVEAVLHPFWVGEVVPIVEEEDEEEWPPQRPELVYKRNYFCKLIVLFRFIGRIDDEQNELFVPGDLLEYDYLPVFISNVWHVYKFGIKRFLKRVVKQIERIKQFGFEAELNRWWNR